MDRSGFVNDRDEGSSNRRILRVRFVDIVLFFVFLLILVAVFEFDY